MFESNRDDLQRQKGGKRKPVRLFVEELEGRCLLSLAITPVGGISVAPDGTVWFPEADPKGLYYWTTPIDEAPLLPDRIGRLNPTTGLIQDFSVRTLTSNPAIIWGPDGNLWFSEGTEIGRLNQATGAIDEYPLSPGTQTIGEFTIGSDNAIWFLEDHAHENDPFDSFKLARIDPGTGALQEFDLPDSFFHLLPVRTMLSDGLVEEVNFAATPSYLEVAAGPGGSFWISEAVVGTVTFSASYPYVAPDIAWLQGQTRVARFSPSTSDFQQFSTDFLPRGQIWGPDGNLWSVGDNTFNILPHIFESGPENPLFWAHQNIVEMDPNTGQFQQFDTPPGTILDSTLTNGPNGNLWFLLYDFKSQDVEMADINPASGVIGTFNLPTQDRIVGSQISAGPDGMLWFPQAHGIGEFNPTTGQYREFVGQAVSSTGQETLFGSPISNNSLSANGTKVSAIAGIEFTTAVTTLTPQTPISNTGAAYQATIDWDDGTTSSLVLTVTDNSTYDVTAGHAYQAAGTYNIKVTIGNYDPANPLGDNPVTVFSTAKVNDPFDIGM
jgi:streptogramin lyase